MSAVEKMIGRVGRVVDGPHLRFGAKGTPIVSFRLEVRPYVPREAPKPDRSYYEVVAFGSLAESVADCVNDGMRVVVAGRHEVEEWTGRDGKVRTSEKVVAEAVGPDLRWDTATVTPMPKRERPEPASAGAAEPW